MATKDQDYGHGMFATMTRGAGEELNALPSVQRGLLRPSHLLLDALTMRELKTLTTCYRAMTQTLESAIERLEQEQHSEEGTE